MKKVTLTAFAVGLCMSANLMAQVPSYVPTNGLVGWWPFNGNANDESGNGNNGTVNGGALLSPDRNGQLNSSYFFDGSNDWVSVPPNTLFNNNSITISAWVKVTNISPAGIQFIVSGNQSNAAWSMHYNNLGFGLYKNQGCGSTISNSFGNTYPAVNQWIHVCYVINSTNTKFYQNGVLVSTQAGSNINLTCGSNGLSFGLDIFATPEYYKGFLDDIGFWNVALTDQEINNLYSTCALQTSISPLNSTVNSGGSLTLGLTSTDNSASIQWQSNASGIGWNNLVDNTIYSGVNSSNLTINNAQLWNHNQEFRVISSNTDCSDTSNTTTIQIGDTCITTIYDTLLTTVTDTLIINTTLGLPAPNNENTILIYPNPASDHITIDNGNYTAMAGYTIKIENNAGQQVFQSAINQQQFYVDLSTWSGNGLYFVHLIDAQNNTVTVRKIVLQ
jgi:hypothetical protein